MKPADLLSFETNFNNACKAGLNACGVTPVYGARDVKGADYLVNNVAGYPVGAVAIALDTGAGEIRIGDEVTFAGDTTTYTLAGALTAGVITLAAPGLARALANNTAVTVGDLPASRVAVESSGFIRASGHMARAANGHPFYDHHTGQIAYTITTPRTAVGSAAHDRYLGQVRAFNTRLRQSLVGLPYKVIKLEETGASVTYINDGSRDRSELVYTVEFGIPGALMDYAQA